MTEETINRLRNVFENGSRSGTPKEDRISRTYSNQEDLLVAVVILGIIVLALIIIIIYGYFKYVKKKKMEERRDDARECARNVAEQLEPVPEVFEISQEPVKTRKRSMTFTQNDEECRKYREDLADAYDNDRSRKKSTVTFVGVE